MAAFTVEIKKNFGVLGERRNNKIELRLVSWNGNPAKYDIRGWYIDYKGEERSAKGITLTEREIAQVYDVIKDIEYTDKDFRVFGTIPQNDKYEIVVQLTKYGYDIRSYSGNYGVKGINLNEEEMKRLTEILGEIFDGKEIEPDEPKEAPRKKVAEEKKPKDKTVNALVSIPVNDGNYPIKTATVEQLKEAIEYMEANPEGQKTRLARCKAKLKSMQKNMTFTASPKEEPTVKVDDEEELPFGEPDTLKEKEEEPKETKTEKEIDKIIKFPKKDTTPIKKLQPTGENHTLAEVEAKLAKEKEMFKNDHSSQYVIDKVIEACRNDQELRDNIMRPEKSYIGAFKYFANKARQGYCMRVDNVGVMDADTAVKYTIDYFNSDEEKPKAPEVKAEKTPKKTATKKASPKKSVWRKGGRR